MRRLKVVRPDQTLVTGDGRQIGMVSDGAGQNAMMDLWSVLSMAGGVATVAVGRAPTDVDGESVTTWVAIEWKNRTDAKEQPERDPATWTPFDGTPEPEEADRPTVAEVLEQVDDDETLREVETEELEDVSSIPAETR
jgi:hypothetical protein